MGFFTTLLSALLISVHGHAFLWTGESAEILSDSTYRLSAIPQMKLSNGSGLNLAAGLRSGWSESTSYGAVLGLGDTDFFGNVHLKWTPIPDFESQPAVGFKFEGLLAREGSDTQFGVRAHSIISKKFERSSAIWIPYASVPVGLISGSGRTDFTSNLAVGTEFFPSSMPPWSFSAEIGVGLSNSFTYIMGVVSYDLDGNAAPANNSPSPRRPTRKTGR